MICNKTIRIITILVVMVFAVSSLSATSVSLGVTVDHANNPVFQGSGMGGEIRVSTDGPLQAFFSQAFGLHSNQAVVADADGKFVPVWGVSNGDRIYFSKTAAGLSTVFRAGSNRLGLDAGVYFADRWYSLAGYTGYDWGRICDFTAGAMATVMYETRMSGTSDGWLFIRLGGAFEAWTFSVLQERLGGKRADGPWEQKGMGALAFSGSCGFRFQF